MLVDPRVSQVGNLRYQRKVVTAKRCTGFPAVVFPVQTRNCDAEPGSVFRFVLPDGSFNPTKTDFVNGTILRHKSPHQVLKTNLCASRSLSRATDKARSPRVRGKHGL